METALNQRTFISDELATQPSCWGRASDVARSVPASCRGTVSESLLSVVELPGHGSGVRCLARTGGARRDRRLCGLGVPCQPSVRSLARYLTLRYHHRDQPARSSFAWTSPHTRIDRRLRFRADSGCGGCNRPRLRGRKIVVQTRLATSTLALRRAGLGDDLSAAIADAEAALSGQLPDGIEQRRQFTFLGSGWSVGLAAEAALKLREAAQTWTESYPAMEFRHGPISITDEGSAAWFLSGPAKSLPDEIRATGAQVVLPSGDPMAEMVRVHRLAVAVAMRKGLNPDSPRNLTRSVVLSGSQESA
jgi:hypothetical protein